MTACNVEHCSNHSNRAVASGQTDRGPLCSVWLHLWLLSPPQEGRICVHAASAGSETLAFAMLGHRSRNSIR